MDEAPDRAPAHLSPEECWALLRTADLGWLATTVTGRVDIVPVNYAVDAETLLVRTAPGGKLTRLTLADQVAFEVDEVDRAAGRAWSVVVHGTAVELHDLDERLAALRVPLRPLEGSPKVRWVRIRASRLTGRWFRVVPPSRWTTPPDATAAPAADAPAPAADAPAPAADAPAPAADAARTDDA